MKGYSVRDVAAMLGLSVGQVRSYVATGFLTPERGPRGEYRFSFQDLVLLRAAKGLVEARIPSRKVRRAMKQLKEQLPTGRPLTAVRIAAQGDRIVVQDGGTMWNPESGQVLFDFAVAELATKVAPHAERAAEQARREEHALEAEDWYELGCELEFTSPREARDAYRRAVELDPHHGDAHVNLGRLLHEAGEVESAAAHYRVALSIDESHGTAAFNLGVALEDLGRHREATAAYLEALSADPGLADAHYNLAGIYERLGNATGALRHLKAYRKLIGK